MHPSTARRRRVEPGYEPDGDDYPRQKRNVVRRRPVAAHPGDLPERFVCPTFLSSAAAANDLRQAGQPTRAMRKQRIANVHPTADIPPVPPRPAKHGKQGKKRNRRPGVLDLALVIFAVAIYLTWAHATGMDWLTPTVNFVNGLMPA